jgi:hypothetical protein
MELESRGIREMESTPEGGMALSIGGYMKKEQKGMAGKFFLG